MFFHVLSFLFIFFHFLSCSFMFFHVLSFSLSLLGAQNLFFWGLKFVTISLDSSYVKNQFLGPSRVVLTRFLSFFLLFYFFIFLIFCSLHFLNFQCFSFSFIHFSEEKSFFFSFFLYFFQFFLLAVVSEFNCILRSRCSMEMWCPDDTGRDSWDWVGPPAWGRSCFNSPEWGGGSSPVKTEPHQIVLLLLSVICWEGGDSSERICVGLNTMVVNFGVLLGATHAVDSAEGVGSSGPISFR